MIGAKGKACLVTMVDRKTRFLLCRKAEAKSSSAVGKRILEMFEGQPLLSITPDRGKEFSNHEELTRDLCVEFYFRCHTILGTGGRTRTQTDSCGNTSQRDKT